MTHTDPRIAQLADLLESSGFDRPTAQEAATVVGRIDDHLPETRQAALPDMTPDTLTKVRRLAAVDADVVVGILARAEQLITDRGLIRHQILQMGEPGLTTWDAVRVAGDRLKATWQATAAATIALDAASDGDADGYSCRIDITDEQVLNTLTVARHIAAKYGATR